MKERIKPFPTPVRVLFGVLVSLGMPAAFFGWWAYLGKWPWVNTFGVIALVTVLWAGYLVAWFLVRALRSRS